jgi:lysozyme
VNLGRRGAALIKSREELRLTAYKPTPQDVWTIGWGSTKGVREGMFITAQEAEARFADDTAWAVATVNAIDAPLSQSMFDALVSLVFNTGAGSVSTGSTIGAALRARRYFDAWAGFALWRKQKGEDLRGLARRRAVEMALYFEDELP